MSLRFVSALVLIVGCASGTKAPVASGARGAAPAKATVPTVDAPEASSIPTAATATASATATVVPAAAAAPRPTISSDTTNEADIAKARALLEQGTAFYREGRYEQAEERLKQAITLYPFMPEANVVLAKILLMRASAARDATLYAQARLMLEMAQSLNPKDPEIDELLQLVRRPNTE